MDPRIVRAEVLEKHTTDQLAGDQETKIPVKLVLHIGNSAVDSLDSLELVVPTVAAEDRIGLVEEGVDNT